METTVLAKRLRQAAGYHHGIGNEISLERYRWADVANAEARDRGDEPDPTPFDRTARHDEIVRLVRAGRINEARALAGARRAA